MVAAVLSIFPEMRKYNRDKVSSYYEVYLKVSMNTLLKRETKGLYKRALKGEKKCGWNRYKISEPKDSDLTIDNNQHLEDLAELADLILTKAPF